MEDITLFSAKEIRFLRELKRRKVPFMIVGLSAAALQGAPVVTQDIDLWFRDAGDLRIQQAARAVGSSYVPIVIMNPPMFAGGGAAFFDIVMHLHGLGTFDEERKAARTIKIGRLGVPVLPLERIIASKAATNRPKDKMAIPVLRETLKILLKTGKTAG